MGISIGDIVNVKNVFCWEGKPTYWKGEVTVIENGGRDITDVNFAKIHTVDLIFKYDEYWEK